MTPLFSKKETERKHKHVVVAQKINPYRGNDPQLKICFDRVWKMCDECNNVYPEHYDSCNRCNNKELRAFHVHNNIAELEKNW